MQNKTIKNRLFHFLELQVTRFKSRDSRGSILIEVVIGAAIISTGFLSLSNVYNFNFKEAIKNTGLIKASYLLEESVEATKILRDNGFSANINSVADNTAYYFLWNGSTWTLTTTPQYVDGKYLRSVVFSPVYRDSNDDIAYSGTLDTDTRRATSTVAWNFRGVTTTRSIGFYVTNIFDN